MAVYLLHFDSPIGGRASHYLGYAKNVNARVSHHREGTGARLTQVANERNINFEIARIWENGDRTLERKLKNRKNAKQLCPKCTGKDKQKRD